MNKPYFIGELRMQLYSGNNSPYRGADPGMELLADFAFVDRRDVRWTAYEHDIVDGATIPWFGQPLVGTPYNRTYLGPSVLHDVYCRDKQRSKLATDRMFYEAMICNGVPEWKARTMWLAVTAFGPWWGAGKGRNLKHEHSKGYLDGVARAHNAGYTAGS